MVRPGYRMPGQFHPFQQMPPYSNDPRFNRFSSPNQINTQRRGYSNPPVLNYSL